MTYVVNDLNGEKIVGTFYDKVLQKTNQQKIKIEKLIKKKGDKLYVKWKGYDSSFNRWIDEKETWLSAAPLNECNSIECDSPYIKMSRYFPKPYEPFGRDGNVKVDLTNYATKTNIKNISHIDTSRLALKSNLASLKTSIDKLDIDKLVPAPADLIKLSDVVKNDVIKKLYMIN